LPPNSHTEGRASKRRLILVVLSEEADGNDTRAIENPAGRTDAAQKDGYRHLLRVVLPTLSPGPIV
jgi:hypothetical protein